MTSTRNLGIEANRPKPLDTGRWVYPAPVAKGQFSYEKGTIWQRGGRFFTQRDMNRLRLNQGTTMAPSVFGGEQ